MQIRLEQRRYHRQQHAANNARQKTDADMHHGRQALEREPQNAGGKRAAEHLTLYPHIKDVCFKGNADGKAGQN